MVKPFPSKTHIGNHMLHPETLMLTYGYDPQLSEGAVKPPVFLTSTFVFKTAEDGQRLLRFRLRPARAAGRDGRRPGLFALQSPQQRNRRGQARDLRAHRELRAVLVRHGGHRHHDPGVRPPRRCHSALPAALWRHGNAADEDACASVDRRRRLRRWRRRSRGQPGRGGGHAQGPGLDDPDRNPGQPDQRAGRLRDDAARRRRPSERRKDTFRSSPATIRCSDRCFSDRSSTAPIFPCTRSRNMSAVIPI